MLDLHSSTRHGSPLYVLTPNKCLFCDCNNTSTASDCFRCYGLTLPTKNITTKAKIDWTIFSINGDDTLEAKKFVCEAWDQSMEGAKSSDHIALYVTVNATNHNATKMLFRRLPGGEVNLCVRRGSEGPTTGSSSKEGGAAVSLGHCGVGFRFNLIAKKGHNWKNWCTGAMIRSETLDDNRLSYSLGATKSKQPLLHNKPSK